MALAAAKKMQLDLLDVSVDGDAGNIAVIQVALTCLSEGAKNACRVALTDENPFEQSFGLSAQLQLARKDALTRSEYNPPKKVPLQLLRRLSIIWPLYLAGTGHGRPGRAPGRC